MSIDYIIALRDNAEKGRAEWSDVEEQLALLVRTSEDTLPLETYTKILFWYADVIAKTPSRRPEAAPFALRAAQRSLPAQDTVFAVKANCLNVLCATHGAPQEEFDRKYATLLGVVDTLQASSPNMTNTMRSEIAWHLDHLRKVHDGVLEH